jgi:hypothetical protein
LDVVLQILNAPATLQISAGGLVAFIIILILRGLLIPKSWVSERLEQSEKRADEWKQIAEERQALIDQQSVVARTTKHVLESLPTGSEDGHNDPQRGSSGR